MSNKTRGIALVAAGVVLNNYVYLNDLITNKHEGMIHVGMWSALGILVALGIVVMGVGSLARQAP
jgi:hypothetical protein